MTEKTHERRRMSEDDIDRISLKIIERLGCKTGCPLTNEEVATVRGMINMKKSSVKILIWVVVALIGLAIKDIYIFIVSHIGWVSK